MAYRNEYLSTETALLDCGLTGCSWLTDSTCKKLLPIKKLDCHYCPCVSSVRSECAAQNARRTQRTKTSLDTFGRGPRFIAVFCKKLLPEGQTELESLERAADLVQ